MFHTEKLSLNDILQDISTLAITPQAKEAITTLQPRHDLQWIKESQKYLMEMKAILQENGSIPLNPLNAFNRTFEDLKKNMVLSAGQLTTIANFLEDVERLVRFMSSKGDSAPTISTYAQSMYPLRTLVDHLHGSVYSDQVLDEASNTLSKLRKNIRFTEDKIKSKLNNILQHAQQNDLLTDNLIAMRDGRYVIPVKAHAKSKFAGQLLDASKSGSTAFIEPEAIRKLSTELQQLKLQEEDEIYRLLSVLTTEVSHYEKQLSINKEAFVHYDSLSAKAKFAMRTDSGPTHINDNGYSHLICGRHPQLGDAAVPLNLSIGRDYKGIVITGPNTGGKTVVLKTVGLLTLMTMCGLLIPADSGSTISIFKHILADIGDGQSITQNLSTFSSHIVTLNHILTYANGQSLILLDEVGSGTEPNEGAGIAMAILETLHQKGATILATTHYSQLKAFAQSTPDFINGSMLFDSQTLEPLYQIHLGEAGKSHALLIALKLGMDITILNRAHQITYNKPFDKKAYSELVHLKDLAVKASPASENKLAPSASLETEPTSIKDAIKVGIHGVKSPFSEGDSVYIPFMKTSGIVLDIGNKKGEHLVEIKGKRVQISHKRLKPFIEKKELYPEDYDMSIVTKTWQQRKTEKTLSKGKN